MKNCFTLIFIFLCQFLPVFPAYFKHIGVGDGLSQTSVLSIHQDILGRMWFGTREGITIYDGNNTIVFKPWSDEKERASSEALYGNQCDFIQSDSNGDIFFRTDGALIRYDIHRQEFGMVRKSGVKTLSAYKGEIWCAAEDSLFTYDSTADSLRFRARINIHSVSCIGK